MIEKWRSFIAITPGQDLCARVRELLRDLAGPCKEAGLSVGWVHPSKLHLTLRFLGDIPVPLGLSLHDACQPLSSRERFDIGFAGVGAFPDPSSPRVIWIGLEDPTGGLAALNNRLTTILAEKGVPPDRKPFRPHLTIGRVRSGRGDLSPVLERWAGHSLGTESVTRVIFYRSFLDPRGAVHEPKWAVNLGRERGSHQPMHREQSRSEPVQGEPEEGQPG